MNGPRQDRRAVVTRRVAVALWVTLAVVVWNVAFDRVIVESGRAYIRAARASAAAGSYLAVGDWMHAATIRGLWIASTLALIILAGGLTAIRLAGRRARIQNSEF
jgi:hypothetical protein